MKTGLVLLASYFILTPLFVLLLVFYQLFVHEQGKEIAQAPLAVKAAPAVATVAGASTEIAEIGPAAPTEKEIAAVTYDAKVNALTAFFERYESPLLEYSAYLVTVAEEHGLDYRLLPAIAMQESTLCQKAPKDSNNCWGFGIYGGKVTKFENLGQAIETVSRSMARDYHSKGLTEPADIMTKYTPSNNGEWAENVSYVMGRIGAAL